MTIKKRTKLSDRFQITILVIESITGVLGTSLILTEGHPYLTLAVLAIGAAAHKIVTYYDFGTKQKEDETDEKL